MDKWGDAWKAAEANLLRSKEYRYFGQYWFAVKRRFQKNETNLGLAKKSLKFGEVVFKVFSWFAMIGVLKYFADKTNSTFAYLIYGGLNIVALFVLVTAATAYQFQFYSPASTRRKAILNNVIGSCIVGIIIFVLLCLCGSLVAEFEAVKG